MYVYFGHRVSNEGKYVIICYKISENLKLRDTGKIDSLVSNVKLFR